MAFEKIPNSLYNKIMFNLKAMIKPRAITHTSGGVVEDKVLGDLWSDQDSKGIKHLRGMLLSQNETPEHTYRPTHINIHQQTGHTTPSQHYNMQLDKQYCIYFQLHVTVRRLMHVQPL